MTVRLHVAFRLLQHAVIAAVAAVVLVACDTPANPSPACSLAVWPQAFAPCVAGGVLAATVTAPSACTWTAATNAPWIAVAAGASGQGVGQVSLTYAPNYDTPRSGLLTVRSSMASQDVQVSQAGCRYGVSQSAFAFGAGGGSSVVDVVQQTDPLTCGGPLQDACVWSAVASVPWISISTPMPRTGDDRFGFTVAANPGAAARVGTIAVRDQTIQITQSGQ